MGPQSPARHRRLSARPRAPAELPELGASTGRGAARGRAAERRWRSASRSADRPRLPPGKLKASFTMRTRENRTAASRAGGVVGGGPGGVRRIRGVGPTRQPVCSERRSRSKRSNAYTFNTTISILHTHASQPRSSEETGDTDSQHRSRAAPWHAVHGAADACPHCPHLDTHITVSSVTHTAHARPAASLRPSPFAQTSALALAHTPRILTTCRPHTHMVSNTGTRLSDAPRTAPARI